jgi:asparagine synthase (glutamine-hydrolysing)
MQMTLLTGIFESIPQHTDIFLEKSSKLTSNLPLPWLARKKIQYEKFTLSLDYGSKQLPFSVFTSQSTIIFILGDILTKTETSTSVWLFDQYLKYGPQILTKLNSYYYLAGIIDELSNTVYLACDQLGLMPLYYWDRKDYFCFSTSPNSFLFHPHFDPKFDLMGVAATLLTMHCTANRTIWQNVKRLPAGHLLKWQLNIGIQLADINSLKANDQYFGWPLARCQRLIQDNLWNAVYQQSKLGDTAILLSGGLDSRIIAGILSKLVNYKVPAITLGEHTDYEMWCAKSVSRALRLKTIPVAIKLEDYPKLALIQIYLEGMQTSFVEFIWWQVLQTLYNCKPRIMTGLLGDAVVGGVQISFGFNDLTGKHDFTTQFTRINRYGFSPNEVSALLHEPGIGEAVVEELYQTWSNYEGLPFQKCWLFDLHHRQRLHVGPVAWRLSFGAWPTLPYVDQALINIMAGMAMPAFSDRRAQITILRAKFPKLATLPLDRVHDIYFIQSTLTWSIKYYFRKLLDVLITKPTERRQYVRNFSIHGSGWETIRTKIYAYRPLTNLFNPEALDRLIPKPSQPIVTPDPIIDGAKYKTLFGLILIEMLSKREL